MKRLAIVLLAALAVACTDGKRAAWRESGHSWRDSGKDFTRALGHSVAGENSKSEWRQTGEQLKDAGKDTANALGESVKPDDETRR